MKFKIKSKLEEVKKSQFMVGSKGVCTIGVMPDEIRRTQFNTQANCKKALDAHLELRVVPKDYVVYKCKACGYFHFGKASWEKAN